MDILVESVDEPHSIDNHGFFKESVDTINFKILATMNILVESVDEPHTPGNHGYPCRKCKYNKLGTPGHHRYPCRKCK